ncbi:MAG: cyclopropane fatty acyl phospholipid synthase [Balneolaceae bacterium]
MDSKAKEIIGSLLTDAGIQINGPEPWDIHVKDERFYGRILSGGSLAAGESYMDGWWDAERLDLFFEKVFEANIEEKFSQTLKNLWFFIRYKILNPQSVKRSFKVGKQHYDKGNELFRLMLDKRMVYSSGYWKDTDSLDEAQEKKLDLICRKLNLKPGLHLLDIGCGWGNLVKFAAENYGVKATGITISEKQAEFAHKECAGLPVTIKLQDYRSLDHIYDRIASVGMVEHVGKKNYSTFMKVVNRCLKQDGLFLLHTIGSNRSVEKCDPWIEKYIFPNSMLPSLAQLTQASEPYFITEDLHSFGPYYDRTLMAWDTNFRKSWRKLSQKYDDTFYRMWRYYLMSSAASFRTRQHQLWQLLFAKPVRRKMICTVR